jgi:DNA-directed RNA polymerase specialized sigma subunit, sigma24 homolog
MTDATSVFVRLRPRLHGLACRFLGSTAEADEVMKDVLGRWIQAATSNGDKAEAWLILATTRLCLSRLSRQASEPDTLQRKPTSSHPTPARLLEQADDVLVAFLCSLELLTPGERAAYLLHEVFQTDYGEIAQTLQKNSAVCEHLVHSAQIRLGIRGAQALTLIRNAADADFQLLRRFANALAEGDLATLKTTLAVSAELLGDGRGRLQRFRHPLQGGEQIAYHFVADSLRYGSSMRIELIQENGKWALSFFLDDKLESMLLPEIDGARIVRLHVRRPDNAVR